MAATGMEVVTIGQAARYFGKQTTGELDDRPITIRQLRAMKYETKSSASAYLNLPDGYAQLEYIESTGTQWIDTGINASSGMNIYCKWCPTSNSNATFPTPFGAWSGTLQNAVIFLCREDLNSFDYFYGNNQDNSVGSIYANRPMEVVVKDNVCTVDGSYTISFPATSFSCQYSIYAFVYNGGGIPSNIGVGLRIYELDITSPNGESKKFIPAMRKSDSLVGMYEVAGKAFYSNSGTGSFISGPEVQKPRPELDMCLVTISQLKRIQTTKIVSWANGTDEEIVAMVAAADEGKINLSDYWHAGDTRTVTLPKMDDLEGYVHDSVSVDFVLTDPGHYTLENGKPCNFVVLQKKAMPRGGPMNEDPSSGWPDAKYGWNGCDRRSWCNSTYYNSIPSTLRPIFKRFKTYSGRKYSSSGKYVDMMVESLDYFSLFSEVEVFGSSTYSNAASESNNSQLDWFKTTVNRLKYSSYPGSVFSGSWFLRSTVPDNLYDFCAVDENGNPITDENYSYLLIAPFGCI